MAAYRLSASLKGHEDDVRGVAFAKDSSVLSCSRDATVRRWQVKSSSPPTYDDSLISHGGAFINSITYLPASSEYPDGLSISGGKEAIIEARQPHLSHDRDPERMLLGHEGNVCALDVCHEADDPYIISGSWDQSAKIFSVQKGQELATLEGHQGSVWAVLAYDKDVVLTGESSQAINVEDVNSQQLTDCLGCADHQIRSFSTTGKLLHTYKGSTDVVRALCKLPEGNPYDADFASAGNDAIIRLWSLKGKEVRQLHGHDNFVYSLDTLPTGELVSSGEDRTVRIWKHSECIQTITHPAISVWSVAVDPVTGDIASGASDRIVRVFSRTKERQAEEAVIQEFEESVKGSSIPKQTMGDINKEELPGPEFLQRKSGTKEGQVQMIREADGNISAHQWSGVAQQWVSIGTVVDAASSGGGSGGAKQEYNGKEYDHVFSVDIEDGKPPLKLPYNLSQNPYEVAKKFIADNELPLSYLDQVANFIVQNTQGATLGQGSADAATPAPTAPRQNALPQTAYLTILNANLSIIQKKIPEINDQLLQQDRKDISLSPGDLKVLPPLAKALEASTSGGAAKTSSSSSSSQTYEAGVNIAAHISIKWPTPQHKIPGLDLLRTLAAADADITSHCDLLAVLRESGALPADQEHDAGNAQSPTPAPLNVNLAMLGLRALVNVFAHEAGRKWALARFEDVMGSMVGPVVRRQSGVGAPNRNVLVAGVTVGINYAVALFNGEDVDAEGLGGNGDERVKRARVVLGFLVDVLESDKVVDGEVLYRALVGVGTLVRVPGIKEEEDAQLVERVERVVEKAGARSKEGRVKSLLEEMRGWKG
ncbi:MAG: hypothetical protein M1831_000068 [Alyxoria varia]|nr:MAG: hypothetical protein M1831_000068 [Alyxoria varia]